MNKYGVLANLESFLLMMFAQLHELRVDVSGYLMDHVCYRTATAVAYETYKAELVALCDSPYESMVNGRMISVFVLREPIRLCGRVITCIELPAHKPGAPLIQGWEHAEFVIDEPFQHFMSRYEEHESRFDRKGLGKKLNPELGFKLENGIQVKFHHLPLAEVIEIEKRQGGA